MRNTVVLAAINCHHEDNTNLCDRQKIRIKPKLKVSFLHSRSLFRKQMMEFYTDLKAAFLYYEKETYKKFIECDKKAVYRGNESD